MIPTTKQGLLENVHYNFSNNSVEKYEIFSCASLDHPSRFLCVDEWLGKGTTSKEELAKWWEYNKKKIGVVEQYGILGLITSFILLFTCIIRRFFSLEMLLFVILFGMSLANIAYAWGAMNMIACVRYFQKTSEGKF